MTSLNNYALINKTGKFDLGYIDLFYDELCIPRQYSTTNVLEIGVYKGDSVKLWRDFFINATVYGIDILDLSFLRQEERIIPIDYTNAYILSTLDLLKNLEPNGFDIIIDDGPHTFESMVFFLSYYQYLLKPKGLLILEDIINTEWTMPLANQLSSISGSIFILDATSKIKSEELKVQWKKGLDVIIFEKY